MVQQLNIEKIGILGCSLGSDIVGSMWCPQWPKEAQDWLNRPRINGWPTIDTISEVIQNGCHVVYVKHRSCRDDKLQWRLSFSLAEVSLLQSWTQVQQIVYHLLRFFTKRELIVKDCSKEDEVLCTYHIKTLMLWTCEEMSSEWWNSSSVITICCELLKKLAEWLEKSLCRNYFIPGANLFHEPSSSTILDKTKRRLNEFRNSGILSHWFIENYILPFTLRHFKLKGAREVMPHLVEYMLSLFEFWNVSELQSLDLLFFFAFGNSHANSRPIIKYGLNSGLRQSFKGEQNSKCVEWNVHWRMRDLPTIQNVLCFKHYDILLYILHTAYGLDFGEISWDSSLFVEVVDTISMQPKNVRSQYHNYPKAYTAQTSQFQFLRAQDLMQNLTGSNSGPEFRLLSLISKEIFRKALGYDDSISIGIAPAALAYLAALHFATSEYQQAIRFCFAVVDQTSQEDKETLNAGCLLFIDDIARIVGLCVLQKKISDYNLHDISRRLYLDLRLSAEVFAHYLSVISAERICKRVQLHREVPDSAFPMDEYLKTVLKSKCVVSLKPATHFIAARQIVYHRPDSLTQTEATHVTPCMVKETVIGILMEYALENMESFNHVIRKDFGIQCNTTDCYRAFFLYKCRQYDQVMQLCERILKDPDLQNESKEFSFANVLLLPPLDSYFDREIQSLLGFHTLFYYLSPLNDDMGKFELTAESTFEHWFARYVYCHARALVFCLEHDYSIKCHYFLGRHFLARYLKVICCIDCNLPYLEALTEFAAQETNLPFERIIRRFLLRKLRIFKR